MKTHLILPTLTLASLLASCAGPNYQTTAQLISSLGQSAASVLAAQYQAMSYGGAGSNYGSPSNGGYDFGQQMPSQQGYAPGYQTTGWYPQQQSMPMPYYPQQPVYY